MDLVHWIFLTEKWYVFIWNLSLYLQLSHSQLSSMEIHNEQALDDLIRERINSAVGVQIFVGQEEQWTEALVFHSLVIEFSETKMYLTRPYNLTILLYSLLSSPFGSIKNHFTKPFHFHFYFNSDQYMPLYEKHYRVCYGLKSYQIIKTPVLWGGNRRKLICIRRKLPLKYVNLMSQWTMKSLYQLVSGSILFRLCAM